MSAVVDTDVFSFIFKNDTRASIYEPHLEDRFLFLSFMSIAELLHWSLNRNWGRLQKDRLDRAFRSYSIQYSNRDICLHWASISNERQWLGKPLASSDTWIAATALYLDVPLITHNAKHFEHINGLALITENK
ncbi:MAG: PIN domain-containing protein [Pyrinomonadaceae bacterium]